MGGRPDKSVEGSGRGVIEQAFGASEVAAEHGIPPARIALAWLLHKPAVTAPIVGATKPHHIQDALAAAELSLAADDIRRLEEPYVPHPVLGHS